VDGSSWASLEPVSAPQVALEPMLGAEVFAPTWPAAVNTVGGGGALTRQGGLGAGSALMRSNAAASASAQGQERSSLSFVVRPERATRPAWWRSR
jgi:hypothetical protein